MNPAMSIAKLGLPLDKTKSYPKPLPAELERWYCYPIDAGHSIVCVLKEHYQTNTDLTNSLIPIPVKSVLRGYEVQGDYVIVDLHDDPDLGPIVPEGDDEY